MFSYIYYESQSSGSIYKQTQLINSYVILLWIIYFHFIYFLFY